MLTNDTKKMFVFINFHFIYFSFREIPILVFLEDKKGVSLGRFVRCILCTFLARLFPVIALHFRIKTCIFTIFSVLRVCCWDTFICAFIGGFQVHLKIGILMWDDDEARDKIAEQSVEKRRKREKSRLGSRRLHTPRVDFALEATRPVCTAHAPCAASWAVFEAFFRFV